jgi:hypothetical protein
LNWRVGFQSGAANRHLSSKKNEALHKGGPDLFVNVHLGTEMHRFIVADLGNRTTIARDLRLEAAHFTRQSASPVVDSTRDSGWPR